MKLKILRFLESLFSIPAAYFGDWADDCDADLHKRLRKAMNDVQKRILNGN